MIGDASVCFCGRPGTTIRNGQQFCELHTHDNAPGDDPGARCVVCGAAANTVRGGNPYCAQHHIGHTQQVPIVTCAIDGCGLPVAPGSRWCGHHQPHSYKLAA